jgi:beta-galactosidase
MKAFMLTLYTLLGAAAVSTAQHPYTIDVSKTVVRKPQATLDLTGKNPAGDVIAVNNEFITFNGIPYFPVMGEFHFSRYPNAYWEESILKMKAGGINVIATYVFWNLHEPREGMFDWTGDRDLARFIALCKNHRVYVVVRVGPYGHGEVKNGAMPEWLYGRPLNIRTDDPEYLNYVRKYYGAIGQQLKGSLFKDGGPVIGIQLENEYQHAGSAWSIQYPGTPTEYTFAHTDRYITRQNVFDVKRKEEYAPRGTAHMATLKTLAREAGLDVPIYTATGWGYAAIVKDGSLPVTAAYAYPSWGDLEPSPFYLFKDIRRDPDYGPVRYDTDRYPSIAAEMGSGIELTVDRRPKVPFNSITPLMTRTVGSGSNGIGYYMYHGGTTPVQNGQFMSEDITGIPKISYDFQAPIGEYGQIRPSFKHLKPLNYFLQTYGKTIAPMMAALPETNPGITKENTSLLRYALRTNGTEGFVFMHNYQDHVGTADLKDLRLTVRTGLGEVNIPESGGFTLRKDQYAIRPVNLRIGDAVIRYATTQPFVSFQRRGERYHVFISREGFIPEFDIQPGTRSVTACKNCKTGPSKGGRQVKAANHAVFSFDLKSKTENDHILVIPEELAMKAWPVGDRLLFSRATILKQGNTYDLIRTGHATDTLLCYPPLSTAPRSEQAAIKTLRSAVTAFSSYQINYRATTPQVTINKAGDRHLVIESQTSLGGLNDAFLKIDYVGDLAQAFIGGDMVNDHLYYGDPWMIGLKRYATALKDNRMYLYFHPMHKGASYLSYFTTADKPGFGTESTILQIKSIEVIPEYKCRLTLE